MRAWRSCLTAPPSPPSSTRRPSRSLESVRSSLTPPGAQGKEWCWCVPCGTSHRGGLGPWDQEGGSRAEPSGVQQWPPASVLAYGGTSSGGGLECLDAADGAAPAPPPPSEAGPTPYRVIATPFACTSHHITSHQITSHHITSRGRCRRSTSAMMSIWGAVSVASNLCSFVTPVVPEV